MPKYRAPGVYVEEISSGSRAIEGAATSIAMFIGATMRGPISEPVLVTSFSEYEADFGRIHSDKDAMGFAARAFFQNGGNEAYIVRLAKGTAPSHSDYTAFLAQREKVPDANIIVLPGQSQPADGGGNPVIDAAIAHAEETRNSMVIVDIAPDIELKQSTDVANLRLPSSAYSAVYYPWLEIANPFYHPDRDPTAAKTVAVAPSAFAAGVWSRVDGRRGVWKAPAGLEADLRGVLRPKFVVKDTEQEFLSPAGVNAIRKIGTAPATIWGARTRATVAEPEWCYVNVRRTLIFVKRSIDNSTQWTVLEPNDQRLWVSLRGKIEGFLYDLFRSGALLGETEADAYFVKCGLGDTMIQNDIAHYQVIVEVGLAVLKPTEFVIFRIRKKTSDQESTR